MKYRYKLKEQPSQAQAFQQKRIEAFDGLEEALIATLKNVRQGKVDTINYYKSNPDSNDVIYPTDLIASYIEDINTILTDEE
jgi:hypothetical protein